MALTYDMNMLQGLRSRHTFCVTLNASDARRPEARAAAACTTPIRCSRRPGDRGAAAPPRDQRRTPHALLRRLLALRLPRGRRRQRAAGAAPASRTHAATRSTCTARCITGGLTTGGSRRARHAFRYRLFMVYLDLAELDDVFRGRWLWSTRRPALARFDRRDHFGDPAQPLDDAVRDAGGRAHRPPARRADPAADAPALLRLRVQPGQLLLLLRRGRPHASKPSSPRSTTRRGANAIATCCSATRRATSTLASRAQREGDARFAVPSDGAALRLAASRTPGERAGTCT